MRNAIAVLGVALMSVTSAAQFPLRTVYVAETTSPPLAPGLLGLDAAGVPTRFVPFFTPNGFRRIEMNARNDALIAWNSSGGFRTYDLTSGLTTTVTLPAATQPAGNGMLDENGGLAWLSYITLFPSIFRSASIIGANPTVVTTVHRSSPASGNIGPLRDGATGGYVGVSRSLIEFFDRQGNRTRTVSYPLNRVEDASWSPWTGDLVLASYGMIARLRPTGGAVNVTPLPGARRIEVCHQTGSGREELLVLAAWPTRLLNVDAAGTVTTIVVGPTVVQGRVLDLVTRLYSRPVWGLGPWRRGTTVPLSVNFGPLHGGERYRVALSFSQRPGISLPGAHLHLMPDALFALTANGDVPGLTRGFTGILNASGRVAVPPTIAIPNPPSLGGLRVYCGAIAISGTSITASNCFGATIQ